MDKAKSNVSRPTTLNLTWDPGSICGWSKSLSHHLSSSSSYSYCSAICDDAIDALKMPSCVRACVEGRGGEWWKCNLQQSYRPALLFSSLLSSPHLSCARAPTLFSYLYSNTNVSTRSHVLATPRHATCRVAVLRRWLKGGRGVETFELGQLRPLPKKRKSTLWFREGKTCFIFS